MRTREQGRPRLGAFVAAILGLVLVGLLAQGCKFRKKTDRAFGDDCVSDAECESNVCTPAGEFCTRPCTYDRDCGKGLVCRRDLTAAGHSCAKPLGAAVGGACQRPEGCSSGHCLKTKEAEPGICSTPCQTPADCPAGMKLCDKVNGAGMLKVCLPDGAAPAQPPAPPPIPVGTSKSGEKIGWVKVKNPKTTPTSVEYRVGKLKNCTKNKDYVGTKVIPGGETWTLEARGEAFVCIRLSGSSKWWKNKVNDGQTHSWVIE